MPAKFIATIFGLKWIKKGCIIFENSQQHSEYQGRYTHEKIYHSSSRLTAQFLQFPVIANSTSRDELIIMDDILCQSGIEQEVIDFVLELEQTKNDERRKKQNKLPKPLGRREQARHRDNARTLFRAALLRKKTGESLRVCCRVIAESPLRQSFC